MLKLAIVDDEFYFREYIKSCLDWKALGCEIVGEAASGEDCLQLLRDVSPDILLLDVTMPNLTGIEVSRYVRENGLPVKIIILSGHNEFEYARKAIQYGVKNYLLKPISEEELCAAIKLLKEEIARDRRSSAQVSTLEEQMWKNEPIIRENFLSAVLRGNVQKHGMPHAAVALLREMQENYRGFLTVVFEIRENAGRGFRVDEKNLWQYAVMNIAQELISRREKAWFCTDAHGHIVCVLAKAQLPQIGDMTICALAREVLAQVKRVLSFSLTAGVGNYTTSVDTICISYEQALYALQNRPAADGVTEYETAKAAISQAVVFNSQTRTQLLLALRTQDEAGAQRVLQAVFEQAQRQLISYEMLHCHCIELLFCCMEYLSELSIEYAQVFPESESMFDLLGGVRSAQDALAAVSDVYERILRYAKKAKPPRGKRQTEEIKRFVQAHFCEEDFNVEHIAEHFCVNYQHLCHSFKKQTGITLNYMIYEMRMEKVKSMIQSGGRNITRLCDEVGYKDVSYFSKCFKKYTGLTLTKYMNQTDA